MRWTTPDICQVLFFRPLNTPIRTSKSRSSIEREESDLDFDVGRCLLSSPCCDSQPWLFLPLRNKSDTLFKSIIISIIIKCCFEIRVPHPFFVFYPRRTFVDVPGLSEKAYSQQYSQMSRPTLQREKTSLCHVFPLQRGKRSSSLSI